MEKTIKIFGNIDCLHPYYPKMIQFFDVLLEEMPFCNAIHDAIQASLQKNSISADEYTIMFPNNVSDVMDSFIDYLNIKTIDYYKGQNITGIKAILKSLIMFQIRLKPNMPDNFRKIFNKIVLTAYPTKNIYRFYALIDTLWYCAGDTATDYNYYTKRFLLGNIYLETCFYACSDTSDNFVDTENYLIRCFDKIKLIEEIKSKLPDMPKLAQNVTSLLGKFRFSGVGTD